MNDLWDNLYSSLRERTAYFYLLILLFAGFGLKLYLVYFYVPKEQGFIDANAEVAFVKIEDVVKAKKAKRDSLRQLEYEKRKKSYPVKRTIDIKNGSESKDKNTKKPNERFPFDPNTLPKDSLRLLGFSDFAIANLKKYLSKGGKINSAEKLKSIYGVDKEIYESVKGLVAIELPNKVDDIISSKDSSTTEPILFPKKSNRTFKKKKWNPVYVNINTADTTEWKKLKGIGPYYSKKLVERRSQLGGFFAKEQIQECWFLPDSTYEKISEYLIVDRDEVVKRNINDFDQASLANHPYIGKKKARIIHNYRKKHGLKDISDLDRIRALDSEYVDTLKIYFEVNDNGNENQK